MFSVVVMCFSRQQASEEFETALGNEGELDSGHSPLSPSESSLTGQSQLMSLWGLRISEIIIRRFLMSNLAAEYVHTYKPDFLSL